MEELRKEFKVGKIIGRGTFGVVRKCKHKKSKAVFALKSVSATDKYILNETRLLKQQLEHSHVIRLHRAYRDEEQIHLLFDYCAGGDALEHMDRVTFQDEFMEMAMGHFGLDGHADDKPTPAQVEYQVGCIVAQVLRAVRYLHEDAGVVHRDIKPGNIMIENRCFDCTETPYAQLIDFGLAKSLRDETCSSRAGTVVYAAPEVMDSRRHSADPRAADMWSVGAVAYTLLYLDAPFVGKDEKETKRAVCKAPLKFPEGSEFSEGAKDFIAMLLNRDPSQRPTARQALRHEWLQSFLACKPRARDSSTSLESTAAAAMDDGEPKQKSKSGLFKALFSKRKSKTSNATATTTPREDATVKSPVTRQ